MSSLFVMYLTVLAYDLLGLESKLSGLGNLGLSLTTIFIILLVFFLFRPGFGEKWFRKIEDIVNRVSHRKSLTLLLVGGFSLITSISLALLVEIPIPAVQDEFSYLLAGDTFAKGRVTNPTHAMWQHLEAPQVIHQPTYASKYPPGQGLFLAIGQVLTGYPIFGVWLSTALAVSGLCWMLMGWVPARWALIGGLLAAFHPVVVFWSQNYWGGSVAMGGGALLLGASQRVMRNPSGPKVWLNSLWLAIGMAILANSRPYEGMVLSLIVVVILAARILRQQAKVSKVSLSLILIPVSLILLIMAACMMAYNTKVTGKWSLMPYVVHEDTYTVAPTFIWQSVKPVPFYRHKEIRDVHLGWEMAASELTRSSLLGFAEGSFKKILNLANSYLRMLAVLIPLIVAPWVITRDHKTVTALIMGGLFMIGLFMVTYLTHYHYAAPAMGLLWIVVIQCMRYLRLVAWQGVKVGRIVLQSLLLCTILLPLAILINTRQNAALRYKWRYQRVQVIRDIAKTEGRHLILVRYGPMHKTSEEWVYNEADIDQSKIVWAREMDEDSNRKLLEYFKDRCAWLLEVEVDRPGTYEEPGSVVRKPLNNCQALQSLR